MKRSPILPWGSTLLLVALGTPAGGASETPRDHEVAVTHTCSAIQVSSADADAVRAPRRRSRRPPSFSASEILDLKLQLSLSPALRGDHKVELSVYTPKGHLYQTLSAALTGPETTDEQGREHQSVRRSPRARVATATLPVAGTTIVASSLYGEWQVEAHLDGSESVCSRPQKFVIEP